eukprot:6468437-Amphidinium_carterae.1
MNVIPCTGAQVSKDRETCRHTIDSKLVNPGKLNLVKSYVKQPQENAHPYPHMFATPAGSNARKGQGKMQSKGSNPSANKLSAAPMSWKPVSNSPEMLRGVEGAW